jgi:PAS domain S-box-containing protein
MKQLGNWDEAVAALTEYQDRLEKALRDGAKSYEQAFKNSPPGIGVHEIDPEMRILKVNPEELRIFGYTEQQMLGRRATDFIVMQETAQRAIEGKFSGTKELKAFVRTFKRADGTAVAMILLDRHIRDKNGKVLSLRTVMTPGTDAPGNPRS